jgi:ribosomal subunit interface protein
VRIEPQIRFIGIDRSDALETAIRGRIARLERHAAVIVGCRVAIELDHKHPRQGRAVRVRVDLTLPGRELVVDRVADEDAYVAMRDAFDDMGRRLEEAMRQRRGEVKHHAPEQHGVVDRLDREAGFGFIRSVEGEEYYFGRSNLAGLRFEQMDIGDRVRFIVEAASDGLQAHRVRPGRNGAVD